MGAQVFGGRCIVILAIHGYSGGKNEPIFSKAEQISELSTSLKGLPCSAHLASDDATILHRAFEALGGRQQPAPIFCVELAVKRHVQECLDSRRCFARRQEYSSSNLPEPKPFSVTNK